MQSQKLVLALGLLLAGTAIAFAQDMRPPINSDDVSGVQYHRTLLRARNSLSFLATLPKRAHSLCG